MNSSIDKYSYELAMKHILIQIESRIAKLKKEMVEYNEPEVNEFYARINELKELNKYIESLL